MDDDDGVRGAIVALQSATLPDRRIAALQSLQGCIQSSDAIHQNSEAVSEALRAQLKHANPLVSAKALSVVPAFVEQLTSEQSDTRKAVHSVRFAVQVFVPLMTERLGDHRERTRDGAKGVLVQLVNAANATSAQQHAAAGGAIAGKSRTTDEATPLASFERELLEHGLRSKVAKIREMSTLALPALRSEVARLPLRPLLPALVDHLSDADAGVRESARLVIITLFASASPTAKSELKKEMEKKGVRKQTQDVIVAQLFEEGSGHPERDAGPASGRQTPASVANRSHVVGDDSHTTSIPLRSASRLGATAVAAPINASAPDVRPVYVASSFELEKIFSAMLPHFNGKETEHNWQAREQDLIKLRGMLKTNVHENLAVPFQSGIHKVAEAILKGVASLRTTLCMHGITLVSELAQHLADDLGTVADTFFAAFIRMAGFTKKIVATASQAAVKEILTNVSYKHKFFEQIAQYISEKNPTTRLAMCQHFIIILNVHARHRRHALEAHGGLELITGFCKKALTDASKEVRALAREAFYRVEEVWPSVGAAVLAKLDPTSLKLVETNRITNGESAFASDVQAVQRSAMPERPSSRLATVAATPPRTPRTPGARGGPSTALLAAKRAAAAQMALQRRKEEEAEEQQRRMLSEAAGEAEGKADMSTATAGEDEDIMSEEEVLEEEMEEQRRLSPPPSQKRSSVRSTPVAVVTPSRASRHNAPSTMPSSIPLPSSPSTGSSSLKRPSSMLLLSKRPRTNSTSSVSSNRSVGRLNLAASGQYGSIAQRFDQSPSQVAAAARDSRSSMAKSQSPSRSSQIGFRPSGRSPHPATSGVHRADATQDTVYDDLAASFDASVHLNTPTRIFQSNRSASPALSAAGRMSRSVTDDRLSARVLTSPASSSVSGSATRRARPMSMIPAPRTPSTAVSRHVKAASDERSPSVQASTRQPNTVRTAASERKVSNGASIPADAPRGVKWFLEKANRLENADLADEKESGNQLSPIKRRPESSDHVAQLAGGRATLPTFKSLVALSKDFKLPDRPSTDSMLEIEDYEEARKVSSTNAMAKFEYDLAVAMWQDQGLFDRLFEAVSTYLRRDPVPTETTADRDLNTAALVLLHRLVDNQFGLFASLGRENDLFALLLHIVRRSAVARASAAADVKSACQAIGDLWCRQTDVVIGISIVRATLAPLLAEAATAAAETALSEEKTNSDPANFTAAMQVLAFKTLTNLFARLPAEVIEEQMEHCKTLVRFGLNHRQIEVRQQAVKVIVASNNVLRDPQSIFGILQPIDRAQQDLLVYYMSKT